MSDHWKNIADYLLAGIGLAVPIALAIYQRVQSRRARREKHAAQ